MSDASNDGKPMANQQPWSSVTLETLRSRLSEFARERDWEQYHTPRNLLLALVGEAGELSELFQWRPDAQAAPGLPGWSEAERGALREELADVLLYLVRLSDVCGCDLGAAALAKMEKNAAKYPAERCRGSAAKYTAYGAEGAEVATGAVTGAEAAGAAGAAAAAEAATGAEVATGAEAATGAEGSGGVGTQGTGKETGEEQR